MCREATNHVRGLARRGGLHRCWPRHEGAGEIWRATLRAERRRLRESVLLGLAALASAVCLSLSLYAIYSALGGVNA